MNKPKAFCMRSPVLRFIACTRNAVDRARTAMTRVLTSDIGKERECRTSDFRLSINPIRGIESQCSHSPKTMEVPDATPWRKSFVSENTIKNSIHTSNRANIA